MFINPSIDLNQTGIYAIVNLCDGRGTAYVGQTIHSFRKRIGLHASRLRRGVDSNKPLQAAWNKYGASAFCLHILEYLNSRNRDIVTKREQYWLDTFRATGPVYNVNECGKTPGAGKKVSEETRQRLRAAQRDRPPISEETRQRMSRAAKRRFRRSPHPRLGIRHTEESIEKMRKAKTGQPSGHTASYPAFINIETDEIIPAGYNLTKMCRKHNLSQSNMCAVKTGLRKRYRNWELLT